MYVGSTSSGTVSSNGTPILTSEFRLSPWVGVTHSPMIFDKRESRCHLFLVLYRSLWSRIHWLWTSLNHMAIFSTISAIAVKVLHLQSFEALLTEFVSALMKSFSRLKMTTSVRLFFYCASQVQCSTLKEEEGKIKSSQISNLLTRFPWHHTFTWYRF